MWSRAAILDSTCTGPDTAALVEQRKKCQPKKHPIVIAPVSWDSFASIAVWDEGRRHDCVDVELQLNELDLVKKRSAHASTADCIRDACNDVKSSFVMIARADHALLMCLKADARAYFKALATVHKNRPFAKAPDVKRDVDEMLKAGWYLRPLNGDAASLVKQAGTDLAVYEDYNAILLEFRLVQHVGTVVNLSRMLDGGLRREWSACVSDAATVPDNPVLIRHCALDNAVSAKEAWDPSKTCKVHDALPPSTLAHNCTINFNADGSRWTCVPAKFLLAGGREEPLPAPQMASTMQALFELVAQAGAWVCKNKPELSLPAPQEQGNVKGMNPYQSAAPLKRHVPPLISTLLREMLDAAKNGQAAEDTVASHQPSNRRLFAAQGFAALTGRKPKAPKPRNKATPSGKQAAAGTSKGTKTTTTTKTAAKRAVAKSKPTAPSQAKPKAGGEASAASVKANPLANTTTASVPTTAKSTVTDGVHSDLANSSAKADAPSKRRKVSEVNIEEAKAKVKAAIAAGTLAKLSIPELKVYLKSIGMPVGGKKSDLLERIQSSGA